MPHDDSPPQPLTSYASPSLHGSWSVPGDKSLSHRALIIASQCVGTTVITGLLEGEDVMRTARALAQLGVGVARADDASWQVQGVGIGGLHESADILDMGNAGTGARLMMGLLAPYPFTSIFTGDASLRSRPMGRVTLPLAQMGAQFAARSGNRLPLALIGTAEALPITYTLPVPSAQVKSALLLAGLNTPGITTVIEPVATRDHTENMLRYIGVEVEITPRDGEDGGTAIRLRGQPMLPPADRAMDIPADPSSAAFLAVAALIVPGSHITLENICINPLRTGLFTTLIEMGAQITYHNIRTLCGEPVADIEVRHSPLRGVNVPAARAASMIDEYPILAVAAAYAEGDTAMHGLAELRVKESDRLAAIADGLAACGVTAHIEAHSDTLHVRGAAGTAPRGGGTVRTHYDHRIAMAFLVLGLASQHEVTVDDGRAIATSFPGFVPLMQSLGARISYPAPSGTGGLVIAIDGPAASGKGTLARRIAEHFSYHYLDTGSLYRAVGLKLIYSGKDPASEEDAVQAARAIDAEDLANPRLRQEKIGMAASVVSAMPRVREALLDFQRRFAAQGGAVLDGRDIGTVVCPHADIKIFVTATMEARAERRHRELQGEGIEVVFESVLENLRERDERDEQRQAAPLQPAADAIILDTSHMDASTVFHTVKAIIDARLAQKAA